MIKTKPMFAENIFQGPTTAGKKLPLVRGYNNQRVLVGYPGKEGCFSAQMVGNKIDLAIYGVEPKMVHDAWSNGQGVDAIYMDLECVPGWGFAAIHELRRVLAWCNE